MLVAHHIPLYFEYRSRKSFRLIANSDYLAQEAFGHILMAANPMDLSNIKSSWPSIAGSFCILNYFQISETHEGIEIIEFCLFQAHFNDFSYVLHSLIDGLAPGVTAHEERAANYVQAVFIDLDENWQMQLFHDSTNH